jgi:hypothetical protein
MKHEDFKMLAELAGFNTAKFDGPEANLLVTRLRTFCNLVENHVLGGYPDKNGNKDISIMGQGIGRGQIKNVSLGTPIVWKKENQQWKTSTIREFMGKFDPKIHD